MNTQNIDPEQNKKAGTDIRSIPEHQPKTGLDNWNERLDENLEPENRADPNADEHAKDYSDAHGSGDQSDE
ncbi:hypothetical protein [Pedobacter metabolipauper]|uniref:Uncharacterized protein n=1 Tax=Pedobacter metabolipauper TaxID=425513 RepID=A0A4V3D199_9SPHI|nr:hypothetical protein [Pedobacter metabolipauper]TDQ09837.1 hypothetical protein ATK78_1996 [Pedobacter metabolipauper]